MGTLSCDTNCPHRAEATSPSTSSQELLYCAKLASNCPKKRAGRKKFRETRHPVYRGVRRRNGCKWVCEVREPNKKNRIWLGTYPTEEMAARAHDVAAMALRGRSACLNFADSAWMLPIPDTGDAEDIRRAAAEAAEMFRPTTEEESEAENSMSSTVPKEEEAANAIGLFWDDEKAFGMPALLEDLAEALLLPPPSSSDWDAMDFNTDMAFWSHF